MLSWAEVLRRVGRGNPEPPRRDERPDAEWLERLSREAYQVTRLRGTERPFSSPMCSRFEPGRYACVCCGTPLFDASEKFETTCAVCDAHLGHVFPDGPPPTGLRFCINAVALDKLNSQE